MTAVTIQSDKIVLNEVKTTKHYQSHFYREKNKLTFWPTQYQNFLGYCLKTLNSSVSSFNLPVNDLEPVLDDLDAFIPITDDRQELYTMTGISKNWSCYMNYAKIVSYHLGRYLTPILSCYSAVQFATDLSQMIHKGVKLLIIRCPMGISLTLFPLMAILAGHWEYQT